MHIKGENMLTSKIRAQMRGEAQNIVAVVQIGKDGLTDTVIQSCLDAFNTRELVKVGVLTTAGENVRDIAEQLAIATKSEVVETKGRKIVLYKFNNKLKHDKIK